VTVKITSCSG